jgi:uncharacterized protein (DUF983 family)
MIVCPECGTRYYLKPLFNSVHRCMKCRWKYGISPATDRGQDRDPLLP